MIEAKRLDIAVNASGGAEIWTADRDGLVGFDVHPSGALLIYVDGGRFDLREPGDQAGRLPARVAAVRAFGLWMALEVDAKAPNSETGS